MRGPIRLTLSYWRFKAASNEHVVERLAQSVSEETGSSLLFGSESGGGLAFLSIGAVAARPGRHFWGLRPNHQVMDADTDIPPLTSRCGRPTTDVQARHVGLPGKILRAEVGLTALA